MAALLKTFQNDLTFKNLRTFFYLVTPNETTFEKVEDVPDYLEQVGSPNAGTKTKYFEILGASMVFAFSFIGIYCQYSYK